MKIGLYGPMANAGYTLTRGLRAAGYDAEYIHEPDDRYPMSQPIWEEVELTIDPARLPHDLPSGDEWAELARAHDWVAPSWIVEAPPATRADISLRSRLRVARLRAAAPRSRRELQEHVNAHVSRIATFSRYDWLVVCGVRVVDAYISGTPYTFWPNGGELSIVPYRSETAHERFEAAAVRAAIRNGAICGTHDPLLADNFTSLGVSDVRFLPFLVDTERYAPRSREQLGDVAREVARRAAGRKTLLIAARQDVRWKGTDRFARAFGRAIAEGSDLFLVVSPWGDDAALIRSLLEERVGADSVYMLPGVASKPLLVELYSAVDAVVDQFTLGVHGSTMLEALACATPVFIWLDVDRFRRRWPAWDPPPVVNVSTEDEIVTALRSIASGEIDLSELGRRGREWVQRVHGIENAHRFLLSA